MRTLLERLTEEYGIAYGSSEEKFKCLRVMINLGLISVGAPTRKIVDRDPFEEVRIVKDAQEATERMMRGWRLLGASSTEPWEFTLARPHSVPADIIEAAT